MTDNKKWADYDLAKFGLSLAIGRRSELIFNEDKKTTPDAARIEKWRAERGLKVMSRLG